MAATINTNIASINAQRNLSLSGQSLNTTMQRLSSGLRVNSAKDDAAGLAIAERMNTQVKGLTVAARNANDGISLAQTAEGALGKVGDMLQRMRELAVQASNATNSASDRVALQAEVTQLAAEIDRVAKQTNFNGQKILDGSFAGAVFQVGANSGDNVTLGALADTRSSQLSTVNYGASKITGISTDDTTNPTQPAIADHGKAIAAGTLVIDVGNGAFNVALEQIGPANSSLERLGQVITAINNKTADTGVTAFMTQKPGTQTYDIQFMSERVDGEGKPMPVNFQGFTSATTGIGYAVAEFVTPSPDQLDDQIIAARDANTGGALAAGATVLEDAKTEAKTIADGLKQTSIASSNSSLSTAITAYDTAIGNAADVDDVNTALDGLVTAYKAAHATTPPAITPLAAEIETSLTAAKASTGAFHANSSVDLAKEEAAKIAAAITGSGLSINTGTYTTAIAAATGPGGATAVKTAISALYDLYEAARAPIDGTDVQIALSKIDASTTTSIAADADLNDTGVDERLRPNTIMALPLMAGNLAVDDYEKARDNGVDEDAVKDAYGILVEAYNAALNTTPTAESIKDRIDAQINPAGALTTGATDLPAARDAANDIAAQIKGSSIAETNPAVADALKAYDTAMGDDATDSVAKIRTALESLVAVYTTAQSPVPSPMDMNDIDEFMTNQRGIEAIDVTTQAGAWVALKKIDSAIDQINGARATLGAMQARFETAVNNIDVQVENLSAARGRIMDADFAVETANLSRTQILQQAGTAMVAQANQIPQNVLQLLQG